MNFLGMGPMELVLIMVLALIVFGPGKLPEIAGQIGRMVRDFRNASSEMSSEFSKAFSLEAEQAAPVAPLPSVPASSTVNVSAPRPPAPVMDGPEAPRIAPPSLATTARANDLQPPY
ncbi:MAG TPA: twin-arginine translocase TatA/TatE family subunit [Chloroflexota bacterium]|nr:twin-arginine translocase TatA/TatE family subunit [Chloroflexota bacterium]